MSIYRSKRVELISKNSRVFIIATAVLTLSGASHLWAANDGVQRTKASPPMTIGEMSYQETTHLNYNSATESSARVLKQCGYSIKQLGTGVGAGALATVRFVVSPLFPDSVGHDNNARSRLTQLAKVGFVAATLAGAKMGYNYFISAPAEAQRVAAAEKDYQEYLKAEKDRVRLTYSSVDLDQFRKNLIGLAEKNPNYPLILKRSDDSVLFIQNDHLFVLRPSDNEVADAAIGTGYEKVMEFDHRILALNKYHELVATDAERSSHAYPLTLNPYVPEKVIAAASNGKTLVWASGGNLNTATRNAHGDIGYEHFEMNKFRSAYVIKIELSADGGFVFYNSDGKPMTFSKETGKPVFIEAPTPASDAATSASAVPAAAPK